MTKKYSFDHADLVLDSMLNMSVEQIIALAEAGMINNKDFLGSEGKSTY
jgi:hypothetical protein